MSIRTLFQGPSATVPGALLLYRAWDVVDHLDQQQLTLLQSTGMLYNWPASCTLTATCLTSSINPSRSRGFPRHPAPNAQCDCGIYGWYSPADTRMNAGALRGVIQATGKCILGTHGARVADAKVLAVAPGTRSYYGSEITREVLRSLAGRVQVYGSWEELVRDYPPDDISELVQHTCSAECWGSGVWTGGKTVSKRIVPTRQQLSQHVSGMARGIASVLDPLAKLDTAAQRAAEVLRRYLS